MQSISACFRNLDKTDWRILQSIRERHNLTWHEFVHQLSTYPDVVEQALNLPSEISKSMVVDATTLHNLMPMWMNNIHDNFAEIKNGLDIRDIQKTTLPGLVIGAGPSLYRHKHLEILADIGFDGVIFAADKVLKDCLEAGVVPDYALILDGSDKIFEFIDHDIVDEHVNEIGAIMCVTTHPGVVKRWKGKKYWFINSISEEVAPNVAFLFQYLLKKTEVVTAGHASSLGWSVAHTTGCREIAMIGVDLSYPADTPMQDTSYYDRYAKAFQHDEEKIRSCYTTYHHNHFGTDCYYDEVFGSYIACSMAHFKAVKTMGCEVINCTEGGALEGDSLSCARFSEYLRHNV